MRARAQGRGPRTAAGPANRCEMIGRTRKMEDIQSKYNECKHGKERAMLKGKSETVLQVWRHTSAM